MEIIDRQICGQGSMRNLSNNTGRRFVLDVLCVVEDCLVNQTASTAEITFLKSLLYKF